MGRRTVMLVMAPAFALSWIVLALARSVPWLLVARFFTGLCGGVFSVVGPIYNGEVADKKVRGALGTFYQLFLCTGLVAAYVIGHWGSLLTLNLCSAAVPALFFGLAWLVPETPVYLMERGDDPGAERALRWLRGPRFDVAREMVLIAEYLEQMRAKEIGLRKAFATRAATRALVISAVTMTIQQASGIKPVVFYTVSIFKGAGSDIDPYVATVITGVVLAVATLVSTLLVDRWGRRYMLLVSGVLTTTCHVVIGIHYYRGENSSIGWLPLAALCAYLVTYSAGYGAVPWVLLGELFPPEIKEIAGPICSSVNWLVAFVVAMVFPMSVSSLGFAVSFWLLGLFCFLGFVFVFVFVVETKGKTLEEIQEQLENTSYFNFKL
ncbi:facilitated trehalose transporter Tret1-like isoform X2 [Bacillus rossius redtenbacheri]